MKAYNAFIVSLHMASILCAPLLHERNASPTTFPVPFRFGIWVFSWAVPGLGMFNESYYIFSVGNVKPIWAEQYPDCWKVKLLQCRAMS